MPEMQVMTSGWRVFAQKKIYIYISIAKLWNLIFDDSNLPNAPPQAAPGTSDPWGSPQGPSQLLPGGGGVLPPLPFGLCPARSCYGSAVRLAVTYQAGYILIPFVTILARGPPASSRVGGRF